MAAKIKARCKFDARFPESKTSVSFTAGLPESAAVFMAATLVKSFCHVMAETYPELPQKPALRKLTITITFP